MVRQNAFLFVVIFLLSLGSRAAAQVGSVIHTQQMSGQGFFGASLVGLGDLDGDGVRDMAVGAPQASDGGPARGAIVIHYLASDGTVLSRARISQTQGGFAGTLSN